MCFYKFLIVRKITFSLWKTTFKGTQIFEINGLVSFYHFATDFRELGFQGLRFEPKIQLRVWKLVHER